MVSKVILGTKIDCLGSMMDSLKVSNVIANNIITMQLSLAMIHGINKCSRTLKLLHSGHPGV